mgnify:CR=1 FL=1
MHKKSETNLIILQNYIKICFTSLTHIHGKKNYRTNYIDNVPNLW